jgi:hypothetical protein
MSFEDVAKRMKSRHQPEFSPYADNAPSYIPDDVPDKIRLKMLLEEHRDRSRRLIVMGLVWLGVGIGITAVTQSMASEAGGGTYIVAYGPMLAGIIYLLKGLLASPPKA